jgi:hypothetical protein
MGHHVHELRLDFRFPSLSLKPLPEGRHDYNRDSCHSTSDGQYAMRGIYPQALPALCVANWLLAVVIRTIDPSADTGEAKPSAC